ncbi:FtsK/SpoIIIE domain-containing protein [Arthrobacter agilis]|uniref:FtsK/SpoIIIE domain-containing protein n=1 Tax=Arthrobacter agilis TaxID=37921 RepID=UPI003594006B
MIPLTRGSYTIGRAGCDIVIADPGLSRRHALLTVTVETVLLEDLDSVNGTFLDGRRISTADLTVSAVLRLGSSRCRIALVDDDGWHYVSPTEVLEAVPIGPEPPRRPSRLLGLTAVLPLVLGVVLALTTGLWFFLAFSGLSAVTGLVPLIGHRRQARVFADTVREAAGRDRLRRAGAVPDPGQTALDALRACHGAPRGPEAGVRPPSAPVLLRLGIADQPAHLAIGRGTPMVDPPVLSELPLVLPCLPGGHAGTASRTAVRTVSTAEPFFTVAGDRVAVAGVLRALLLQLAHPEQGYPPVVCWGSAHLPLPARFLANVLLTKDPSVLAAIIEQTGALLLFQVAEDLPEVARGPGVLIIRFRLDDPGPTDPAGSGTVLPGAGMVVGEDARARIDGREYRVLPDGVSERTFERTARALARAGRRGPAATARRPGAGPGAGVLPASVSLWSGELGPDTLAASIPGRWAAADAQHPSASIGRSPVGPVSIDLVRDGPHLLVAGTTGSGKSEFLRTLVLGLALDQPPEHLALLLLDYKGGSGLGALASLPHCVGSLTDLSSESTARALTSLRAELRRRERLCADHGAQDLDELRRISPSNCPPRLVVVIDEFRVLSDDVPTAGPDLMRIAALGRSLGVHLVLATQRVQGAVTPDLRANLTTSVLLRVQTAMESQDLLGSGVAAEIPVGAPGRAFLRRGNEPPVAVQVASSSDLPAAAPGWQDVTAYLGGSWAGTPAPAPVGGDWNDRGDRIDGGDGRAAAGPGVLERAVAGLVEAAGGAAAPSPFRPVLPPLPSRLPPAACTALPTPDADTHRGGDDAGVLLGIADHPEHQAQHLLRWCPGQPLPSRPRRASRLRCGGNPRRRRVGPARQRPGPAPVRARRRRVPGSMLRGCPRRGVRPARRDEAGRSCPRATGRAEDRSAGHRPHRPRGHGVGAMEQPVPGRTPGPGRGRPAHARPRRCPERRERPHRRGPGVDHVTVLRPAPQPRLSAPRGACGDHHGVAQDAARGRGRRAGLRPGTDHGQLGRGYLPAADGARGRRTTGPPARTDPVPGASPPPPDPPVEHRGGRESGRTGGSPAGRPRRRPAAVLPHPPPRRGVPRAGTRRVRPHQQPSRAAGVGPAPGPATLRPGAAPGRRRGSGRRILAGARAGRRWVGPGRGLHPPGRRRGPAASRRAAGTVGSRRARCGVGARGQSGSCARDTRTARAAGPQRRPWTAPRAEDGGRRRFLRRPARRGRAARRRSRIRVRSGRRRGGTGRPRVGEAAGPVRTARAPRPLQRPAGPGGPHRVLHDRPGEECHDDDGGGD